MQSSAGSQAQDGQTLWVANIPDASVIVFDTSIPESPVLIQRIPVGLGPVTIRRRPGR